MMKIVELNLHKTEIDLFLLIKYLKINFGRNYRSKPLILFFPLKY